MDTKNYKYADVRFNNGNGALLCSVCRVILAYGFNHDDVEHVCDGCLTKKPDLINTMKRHPGLGSQRLLG